jgi:hypothetical protein
MALLEVLGHLFNPWFRLRQGRCYTLSPAPPTVVTPELELTMVGMVANKMMVDAMVVLGVD